MTKPTLTIQAVIEIAPTTAKANGTITNTGGVNANKRGFVYSLASHADPGDVQPGVSGYEFYAQQQGSFTFGIFDIELSSLAKATKFYIRAFAHNSYGYSYSDEIYFTTLANVFPGAIFSPRIKINKDSVNYDSAQTTRLYSPDVTKLDDEVVSIETELGLLPKATSVSVSERLKGIRSLSDASADVITIKGSNVGIGTASPGAKLEIADPSSGSTLILGRASGVATIKAPNTAGGKYMIIDSTSGGYISLNNYVTDNILLAYGGGNVGIGTTTPTVLLDINSDIMRLRTAKTPATAGAAGNAGNICWDSDFIYICVATNSWKKVSIAAW